MMAMFNDWLTKFLKIEPATLASWYEAVPTFPWTPVSFPYAL